MEGEKKEVEQWALPPLMLYASLPVSWLLASLAYGRRVFFPKEESEPEDINDY